MNAEDRAAQDILAGLARGMSLIFRELPHWEDVDQVWESGKACEGCKFHHRWTESTGEKLHECGVRNEGGYKPSDCPGLE